MNAGIAGVAIWPSSNKSWWRSLQCYPARNHSACDPEVALLAISIFVHPNAVIVPPVSDDLSKVLRSTRRPPFEVASRLSHWSRGPFSQWLTEAYTKPGTPVIIQNKNPEYEDTLGTLPFGGILRSGLNRASWTTL